MIEEFLNILLDISKNLEPIVFWKDFSFWNVVALFITLLFLIRYTRATEKMLKNQMMPAVDINMFYDKDAKKTYFWFSNASIVPAFITLKIKIETIKTDNIKNIKEEKYGPYRIAPYHPQVSRFEKTATSFDFLGTDDFSEVKIILNIVIESAFDKNNIGIFKYFNKSKDKLKFTKSYRFDKSELRWNETTWIFPDPPFPR